MMHLACDLGLIRKRILFWLVDKAVLYKLIDDHLLLERMCMT